MLNLPRKRVYFYTFSVLISYFTIDFVLFKTHRFFQLNFNWSEEQIINTYTNCNVDSVAYNYLKLDIPNSNIVTPKNTFVFKTLDRKYYFRASTIQKNLDTHHFKHVLWLKEQKPALNSKGDILEVNLPLIQKGSYKINTIGDTFLTYKWANHFRKELAKQTKGIFVGTHQDLYAYPHDALFMANSNKIAKEVYSVKNANIYVLFFGNHDQNQSSDRIRSNWENILTELTQRKDTQKIIVLTLPPARNFEIDNFHKSYNTLLESLKKDYPIILVDVYQLLDKDLDLDEVGRYPNKQGYVKISQKLAEEINETH